MASNRSRENRPYARQGRRANAHTPGRSARELLGAKQAPSSGGAASRLLNLAGGTDRAAIDVLERRQLLFSMTVTQDDVDPNTGIGTVTVDFGYVLPYLAIPDQIQDPQDPQTRGEDFNQVAPGNVNSGQIFAQSRIRTRHNFINAADYSVQPPGDQNTERFLRVSALRNGNFFSFQLLAQNAATNNPQAAISVAFNVRPNGIDNTGLDTDRVRVSLRLSNQTIATFTGAQLRAQIQGGNPALGVGLYTFNTPQGFAGFDEIRIEAIGDPQQANPAFEVDDLAFTTRPARFAQAMSARAERAARAVISGPVGATASFFDLDGNPMLATLALLPPPGGEIPAVDIDDNYIADFNNGIGRVVLSGTDARTSFTLVSGRTEAADTRPDNADNYDGQYAFFLKEDVAGFYDDMEDAGFGYFIVPQSNPPQIVGLPAGPGGIVIGAPWVRSSAANPNTVAPGVANGIALDNVGGVDFSRPDQGVFLDDGGNIGSIYIDGILHGSSRFSGFVDKAYVGYLVGSMSVQGDLGSLTVGTDAGVWGIDSGVNPQRNDRVFKTNAQLFVGRTLGTLDVAGRNLLDLVVQGDVNSPLTRPARDVFTYYEREFVFGFDPATQNGEKQTVISVGNNADFISRQPSQRFRTNDQGLFYAEGFFRNDLIESAEYIGGPSSGVRIVGDISGRDTVNTGEDASDVFAFAADGTQEIVIEGAGPGVGLIRIMNDRGETIASPGRRDGTNARSFAGQQFRFKPAAAGVYFLVVSDAGGADTGFTTSSYSIAITGLAPTTVGMIRSAAGTGYGNLGPTVTILAGDLGAMRVGFGAVGSDGQLGATTASYNEVINGDDSLSFMNATVSVAGSVYNISAGGDVGTGRVSNIGQGQVTFVIGGNLGSFQTGRSRVVGGGPGEGDVAFLTLSVGGSIGEIDISGGVGMDQDFTQDPRGPFAPNSVRITTGTNGGRGDIGVVRTGFHIAGDTMDIRTSPGSTIDLFQVSEQVFGDQAARSGIYEGTRGVGINTGIGSDVRFVQFPRLDLSNSLNIGFNLFNETPLRLVDDAGATVVITITGAGAGVVGRVLALPIDGSQGVALGLITANLAGGASLSITGEGGSGAPISIGRIILTGSTPGSSVNLSGNVEIDVYELLSTGPLNEIGNTTPRGDIVTADVAGLNVLNITAGDLGFTQLSGGRRSSAEFAPNRGVVAGVQGGVGGPIGFSDAGGILDDDFNGGTTRAENNDDFAAGNAFLDDIGAPVDAYADGLFVRGGDVQAVNVSGNVGDVVLQGDEAQLLSLRANNDGLTPFGGFEGILGSIYAFDIGEVDVGDGLVAPSDSPFARAGIFAADDIGRVSASRPGSIISGPISASSISDVARIDGEVQGVGEVSSTSGGGLRGASILGRTLDDFWTSLLYGDDNRSLADIGVITVSTGNVFRTSIRGRNLDRLNIAQGFYDATEIALTGSLNDFSVNAARNSTLQGSALEFFENSIGVAGDVQQIRATLDLADLIVDVNGSVIGGISARNLIRTSVDVDNRIESLTVQQGIRSSSVVAGRLPQASAVEGVESSTFVISGPLDSFQAGRVFRNSSIAISGPDGRLGSLTATDLISGRIEAAGPIDSVVAAQGDLSATIITTTALGNVGTLRAGRDLNINADVSGNVASLVAGRHIGAVGQKGAILVRGDLSQATAQNGQLYSDIRAGGSITGTVNVARVVSKPNADQLGTGSVIAFGRIAGVNVQGDFGGDVISYSGGIGSVSITNGSFLPGRTISAFANSVASVTITNGNLYGSIFADFDISAVRVVAGADGIFGDVGINPAFNQFTSYDSFRNQLPVGVAQTTGIDGPRIAAGRSIVSFQVSGGSVFETTFFAGRNIQNVTISGDVSSDDRTTGSTSAFAAGDSIDLVSVGGALRNAEVFAGVTSFGADNRPGGVGVNADLVKAGSIARVAVTGAAVDSAFYAGVTPGADGVYGSGDDRFVLGQSNVNTLTLGSVTNSRVTGDILSSAVANDNRLIRNNTLASADPLIDSGPGTPGVAFTGSRNFSYGGGTVTLNFTGPGQAFFDNALGRVTLRNTTTASGLAITSSLQSLVNLSIVTNDDASLGTLNITPALIGASNIVIDGALTTANFGTVASTGRIAAGGDVSSMTFAALSGGFVSARALNALTVTGDFGSTNPLTVGEANIQALSGGTFTFRGNMRGSVSVDRSLNSVAITGDAERANVRVGGTLASFSAANVRSSFVAAYEGLTSYRSTGETQGTSILAGVDLGTDASFGGSGAAGDRVTAANLGSVTVGGNFRESSAVAGVYRGPDGFYGTADDTVSPGLSTLSSVTITGNQVGSTRAGETYRIAASGTVNQVTINGSPASGAIGNFAVESNRGSLAPSPVLVRDIRVTSNAGVYTADIVFNQQIDGSTLGPALSVSEVRGAGDVTIRLIDGVDYTVSYNAASSTARVTFATSVTRRNLPQVPGLPGPGVYRFEIDQAILSGKAAGTRVDGDGDGFSVAGDNFVGQAIVGDAGDKITPTVQNPGSGNTQTRVDFYGPSNLDFVFDSRANPDGLPDANKTFTIRGTLGDHPDHDANNFRISGDSDVYQITLQAGQILRLGGITGAASAVRPEVLDPNLNFLAQFDPNAPLPELGAAGLQAAAIELPSEAATRQGQNTPLTYLIKTTGVYTIVVGNAGSVTTAAVPNPDPTPSTVGSYEFTLTVFDDADSGFTAPVPSGNGALVANAPPVIAFAGVDGVLGTADDLTTLTSGDYTFTRTAGADNQLGTADDLISGSNASGITSTRVGGQLTNIIEAAIGPKGFAGVPSQTVSDVDVFHLNNRQPIQPGQRMRLTVRLSQTGSDLGSISTVSRNLDENTRPADRRGSVQFALFDTSASTGIDDAVIVFSPTDFSPVGGTPNTTIADNGTTKYGYDEKGDFFIDFVVPDRTGQPGVPATFAAYVQGVLNTDYTLEVKTNENNNQAVERKTQNFYIETNGGTVNWLEAGGINTTLAPFSGRSLGFQGLVIDGQNADTYILSNLTTALTQIFRNAFGTGSGFDVRFSTNPADFAGQPFSTVFISNTADPRSTLFDTFDFGAIGNQVRRQDGFFFSTQPFGISEHSDPFNADLQDEAVIAVPSFGLLGYTPSRTDVDLFVQSLTAAVSRRAGELMGLRISGEYGTAAQTFDFQSDSSVVRVPGQGRNYSFPTGARALSDTFDGSNDTDFFLGRQDSRSLLDRVLGRI